MAYRKRKGQTSPERHEKIKKAWDLHVRGYYQAEIAEQLGVCQQTVSEWIKETEDIFIAHFANDIENVKREQVTMLMFLYREAIDSWEKSKAVGPYGENLNNQYGDSKYIVAALSALGEIRKIMGANSATKYEFKGIDVKKLSAEELQRITEITDPSQIAALGIEGL
jgi:predicted DNA-binding protein YlxM (UPF0122 family)